MKAPRVFAMACAGLLAFAGTMVTAQAGGPTVCTWGGTPTAPTGHVDFTGPGLRNELATTTLPFVGWGELSGGPGCSGTMTFTGEDIEGSSCRLFINHGAVSGLPGVVAFQGEGTAYQQGILISPDGGVAGRYEVYTSVAQLPQLREACATSDGVRSADFSAMIELVA